MSPADFDERLALAQLKHEEPSESWQQTAYVCFTFYQLLSLLLATSGIDLPERSYASFLPGNSSEPDVESYPTPEGMENQHALMFGPTK